MKRSEGKLNVEMFVLSLMYNYVAVCRFCTVRCVTIIGFCLLFSNYSTCVFNILYMFVVLLSLCFLCCVLFIFVLFCVLFLCLYTAVSFLFLLQVYRPLTPGGNQIAVNKYRVFHDLWTFLQEVIS